MSLLGDTLGWSRELNKTLSFHKAKDMTEITEAVERPAGHCKDEAAWAEFRDRYLPMARERLSCGDMTDFELANHVFMVDRSDLGLIVAQTAAKDRIRWLSVQLAEKTAEAARLQEEVKGLRGRASELDGELRGLLHGLPELLESGGLTDEEGLIEKAWMTLTRPETEATLATLQGQQS